MTPQLTATLQLIKAWVDDRTHGDSERGNVTTEHVLWAVAVILLVGLVVAALKAFVEGQIALIH